jgi:hypothetical protein
MRHMSGYQANNIDVTITAAAGISAEINYKKEILKLCREKNAKKLAQSKNYP